jgi:hypothetical protein
MPSIQLFIRTDSLIYITFLSNGRQFQVIKSSISLYLCINTIIRSIIQREELISLLFGICMGLYFF